MIEDDNRSTHNLCCRSTTKRRGQIWFQPTLSPSPTTITILPLTSFNLILMCSAIVLGNTRLDRLNYSRNHVSRLIIDQCPMWSADQCWVRSVYRWKSSLGRWWKASVGRRTSIVVDCRSMQWIFLCGLSVLNVQDLKRVVFVPCCFWYYWACTWKTRKKFISLLQVRKT